MFGNNKNAFTLAEVLITLGIIGVVAAMTIPNLMSNIKAQQYTKKFKKTISTLSQAGRIAQANYGWDYAGVSTQCSSVSGSDSPEEHQTVCALLNGSLTGKTFYWGLSSLPNYKITSQTFDSTSSFRDYKNQIPIYTLSDGTLIILSWGFGVYGSGACSRTIGSNPFHYQGKGNGCYAMIDVNGLSLPNKETSCSVGSNTFMAENSKNCVVKNKDINDIFYVGFYDSIVTPITSASWYVYNNAK